MVFISPKDLLKEYPFINNNLIKKHRDIVKNILIGNDNRFLVILGPCSIHNIKEAMDYADFLNKIKNKYKNLFLVMRVYGEKPRSSGLWKGFINDPDLNNTNNIEKGIIEYRKLCLSLIEKNIPIANEMLCHLTFNYFKDLIAFSSIGSRTSESQIHRNFMSSLTHSIGIKNDMKGDIEVAAQGIKIIKQPHTFLNINKNGNVDIMNTSGNKFTFIILRGSTFNGPNYSKQDIEKTEKICSKYNIFESIIIDASHGNSNRQYKNQIKVVDDIIFQKKNGNKSIKGIMLESYINEGKQNLDCKNLKYGVSITDCCLNFNQTEDLLNKLDKIVKEY